MNKSALGTIIGAALLGLRKPKMGNRNTKKGIVVLSGGHRGDDIRLNMYIPDDLKHMAEEDEGAHIPNRFFLVPSNATIRFFVETYDVEFPEYPDMDHLEEELKNDHFEFNEEKSDDDPDKADWNSPDDVPEFLYYDYLQDKKDEAQMEYMDEIGYVIGQEITDIENTLKTEIDDTEYFERSLNFVGKRNAYISMDAYNDEYEEEGYVKLMFELRINCENPLFVFYFIQDLGEYLLNSDFTVDTEYEINDLPEIIRFNFDKPNKVKLRRR